MLFTTSLILSFGTVLPSRLHEATSDTSVLHRIYPRLSLRLRAPLEIQNLLPYDVRIRVYDKHIEHNWKTFLRAGGVIPMNIAELSHLLLLSVEVQDTGELARIHL